ncbi:MAG: hypothetical protein ABIQ72_08955 [Usitatibacter sp.]
MSETTRISKALIESRVERFESRHNLEESQQRLAVSLKDARLVVRVVFTQNWKMEGGVTILEARFDPAARTQRFLKTMSIALTLLIIVTVWGAMSSSEPALAWLLPIFTVLVVLAFPFVFVAMGSNREAEEARIRKAIRVALVDEDPAYPPPQRWKDED